MSTQKENPEMQLVGEVVLEATIYCSVCDNEETAEVEDMEEALRDLYKSGWRVDNRDTYCPKCTKIYLKAKKKKK